MKPSGSEFSEDDNSTITHQNQVRDSFGGMRSRGSWRSRVTPQDIFDEIESASMSQAGDMGDLAIPGNRCSDSGNLQFSEDDPAIQIEKGCQDGATSNADNERSMPLWVEYVSYLVHLAVFGILGVLTRYLLRELFGPGVADLTSDKTVLYLDLPSNMVGSFLMGWLGVVFKEDISQVSDILAVALSTGYLGSLTTFSGWNQDMLQLCVEGYWDLAVFGIFIDTILAAGSISLGVETAKVFRWLLGKLTSSLEDSQPKSSNWRVNSLKKHLVALVILMLMLSLLWGVSGSLLSREFNDGGSSAQLWLACMVGPPGVWLRWFLARLNGRGLGRKGFMSWMPFGTLIANVAAACVMAALATVMDVVNTQKCDTIAAGIQFGFLGCLSTVSTFMAEFHAMRNSSHPWRAHAYASTTILVSFVLGTLIYTVPVLTKGASSKSSEAFVQYAIKSLKDGHGQY